MFEVHFEHRSDVGHIPIDEDTAYAIDGARFLRVRSE